MFVPSDSEIQVHGKDSEPNEMCAVPIMIVPGIVSVKDIEHPDMIYIRVHGKGYEHADAHKDVEEQKVFLFHIVNKEEGGVSQRHPHGIKL